MFDTLGVSAGSALARVACRAAGYIEYVFLVGPGSLLLPRKGISMVSHAMRLGAGALLIAAIAGSRSLAGEKEKPAAPPDKAAMEKMMEEYATPGPQHEQFKELVGDWKADVKSFWDDPKKPQVSTGSARFRLLMGGRFLQQKLKCQIGGEAFEGLGISGYDKARKKYVSIWIDNMGTGIMQSVGKYDKATDTFTETSESAMPTGKMKVRTVSKPVDKDKFIFTMYMTMPGAPETKVLEITYTRKK
jgi:hypothetical protein